eukprot:1195778-Prorocentrum_minimum.AAC.5
MGDHCLHQPHRELGGGRGGGRGCLDLIYFLKKGGEESVHLLHPHSGKRVSASEESATISLPIKI